MMMTTTIMLKRSDFFDSSSSRPTRLSKSRPNAARSILGVPSASISSHGEPVLGTGKSDRARTSPVLLVSGHARWRQKICSLGVFKDSIYPGLAILKNFGVIGPVLDHGSQPFHSVHFLRRIAQPSFNCVNSALKQAKPDARAVVFPTY